MEIKTCSQCGETKSIDLFDPNRGRCKPCRRAYQRTYRANTPGYHRKNNLRQRYGLSYDDFQSILHAQNYCCAICEVEISHGLEYRTNRSVAVDHNHDTGEVRGILCSKCNLMLGHARESTEILYKSIVYLSERGTYEPKK